MLFEMILPSSFIIARPGVPLPYFSQLSGTPGLLTRLSAISEIKISVFSVSSDVIALFVNSSEELSTIPLIISVIINTIAISITKFPLLSIIFIQPVFFSVGTV